MSECDKSIEEVAKEIRNRYYREYRKKNPEKIKEIKKRYWERKAKLEQEKAQTD